MSLTFLLCSERSGSNLITKLMNGHEDICGPSIKHIFNPVARNIFRYEPLSDKNNWNELLSDIHNLMAVNFSIWKRTFTLKELNELAVPGDIASLLRNIYLEEARAHGKQHLVIKENQVYEFLPFLLLNYPESKYIYQYRDPRDMALSWKKNTDHRGGVVAAARQWKNDQQNTLKNIFLLKRLGKSFSLSYEDLIDEPLIYAERITQFLGIPHDPGVSDYYKDELTQMNSALQTSWSNLGKGVLSDNKNKYLHELSEREILAIEKICWFEMNHLGYSTVNRINDIHRFKSEDITTLEQEEESKKSIKRSEGLDGNIAAKRKFYQRVSWENG